MFRCVTRRTERIPPLQLDPLKRLGIAGLRSHGLYVARPSGSRDRKVCARRGLNGNSAKPAVALSAKEYAVQADDSLYKISMKLYGKGDKVDAIYELNKEKIGSDPARLKVGMVLKLPEAPSAVHTASAAR